MKWRRQGMNKCSTCKYDEKSFPCFTCYVKNGIDYPMNWKEKKNDK